MGLTTEQYNLWRSKKYNPGENKSDSDGGKFKRQKVFAREKKRNGRKPMIKGSMSNFSAAVST